MIRTARICSLLILALMAAPATGCIPRHVVSSVNVQIVDNFQYSEQVGEMQDPSLWLFYKVKSKCRRIPTATEDGSRCVVEYHLEGEMTITRGEDTVYSGPFFISSREKPLVDVRGQQVYKKRTSDDGWESAMILLSDLADFRNGTVVHVDCNLPARSGGAKLREIKLELRDRKKSDGIDGPDSVTAEAP